MSRTIVYFGIMVIPKRGSLVQSAYRSSLSFPLLYVNRYEIWSLVLLVVLSGTLCLFVLVHLLFLYFERG